VLSVGSRDDATAEVRIQAWWSERLEGVTSSLLWPPGGEKARIRHERTVPVPDLNPEEAAEYLNRIRIYSLDERHLAAPATLQPNVELDGTGAKLVTVLDTLRDADPERFEQFNTELAQWLPEFDRVLCEIPSEGARSLLLRTREGQHRLPAGDLSSGTLIALGILALAYSPVPPSIACFEEPDRAIHPRLLGRVQEALYRLAYPEDFGEEREPVQVIATTHNPYFLDLYKERPDEVVIASKEGLSATFERLSDHPRVEELLEGVHLGDIWYTGILGGVPAGV
jgi:predicted ATPase